MEEENFKKVMNEFYSFKQRLINKIKGDYSPSNEEECYIINETWNNKLEKCFNQYESFNDKISSNYLLQNNPLINEGPEIIPNFTKIIFYINNNNKFEIFSKSLFDYLYTINDLNNCNYAKYYAGNNKLIIEFQGKEEDKALLLIDPLNKDEIKKNSFIILINNEEKERKLLLYKDLINLENINEIFENINYNNSVIPFEKYMNNNIKKRTLNIKKDFKKDILKVLISIFYYEKPSDINENIYNIDQQYYLINPDWLKEFKKYYNYQNLYKLIIKDQKYNNIKFNQLKSQIENIINFYINKNIIYIEKRKLNEYLASVNNINKGKRIKNYYIAHSSIIDIIKPYLSINEGIAFEPKNLFIKDKKIYFYYNNNIIIGSINEQHIFISNAIISYKSLDILNNEKKIFFEHSIKEYITLRNCKKNNLNKLILINENNEEIGELIKLLHINKNAKNKSAFNDISKNNKNKIININIVDAKSRKASSEPNMRPKLNEDINRKKRQISERYKENNANFKSNNNKSFSKSIEIKGNSHSKVKETSSNNSFYKNQKQNNIHTNIVVRDF